MQPTQASRPTVSTIGWGLVFWQVPNFYRFTPIAAAANFYRFTHFSRAKLLPFYRSQGRPEKSENEILILAVVSFARHRRALGRLARRDFRMRGHTTSSPGRPETFVVRMCAVPARTGTSRKSARGREALPSMAAIARVHKGSRFAARLAARVVY